MTSGVDMTFANC